MFTVKIFNYTSKFNDDGSCQPIEVQLELSHIYLREWKNVEVWLPASQCYKDKVKELIADTKENPNGLDPEHLAILVDLQSEYKAFITYQDLNGDDNFYCIAELEEAYITDSGGNTVHFIK
jgi:hypothetical protein